MRLPGGSLIKFFVLTYAVTWTCFVSRRRGFRRARHSVFSWCYWEPTLPP